MKKLFEKIFSKTHSEENKLMGFKQIYDACKLKEDESSEEEFVDTDSSVKSSET